MVEEGFLHPFGGRPVIKIFLERQDLKSYPPRLVPFVQSNPFLGDPALHQQGSLVNRPYIYCRQVAGIFEGCLNSEFQLHLFVRPRPVRPDVLFHWRSW